MGSAYGHEVSEGGEGLRGSGPTPPPDLHAHELAVAQLAAAAAAAERLDTTYARLERRLDRITASMAAIDSSPIPVSPGQLRLVIGG